VQLRSVLNKALYDDTCSDSRPVRFDSSKISPTAPRIPEWLDCTDGVDVEKNKLLPLPEIQPPYLCCPTQSLATVLTELRRLSQMYAAKGKSSEQ